MILFRITAIACVTLASLTSAIAEVKFATSAEFSSGIVGKSMSSTTAKGQRFTAMIKSGGTGDFQIEGKPVEHFKWKFTGNTFCWTFPNFTECNHVELESAASAKFIDAKSGKLNNAYVLQ